MSETRKTTWQEELEAMGKAVAALMALDTKARKRAFDYLWDRFVAHPSKEDGQ